MLSKGDLIRIPADTCIVKNDLRELSIIETFEFTKEPKVGIFISYIKYEDVKIFLGNDYWIVNIKDINYIRRPKC